MLQLSFRNDMPEHGYYMKGSNRRKLKLHMFFECNKTQRIARKKRNVRSKATVVFQGKCGVSM